VGTLWHPDREGEKTRRTKKISRREDGRGSDEAIVSEEPTGQQNPTGSQGPLDWSVAVRGRERRLDVKASLNGNYHAPLRDCDCGGV